MSLTIIDEWRDQEPSQNSDRYDQAALAIPLLQLISERLRSPEQLSHTIRPVNNNSHAEVAAVSQMVQTNFSSHPEYADLPRQVIVKYLEANSPEKLLEALQTKGSISFVLMQESTPLGLILCRVAQDERGSCLQIRRLHASLLAKEKNVLGVGKSLLNMAASTAMKLGICRLSTTASLPAKSYFEHLGWDGKVAETNYPLEDGQIVSLSQFCCEFYLDNSFEGF